MKTDVLVHLDAGITALEADLAAAEARATGLAEILTQARELRSAIAQRLGVDASPDAAPAVARQVSCPDCGQMYPNRNAVDTHRRAEHPKSAAKPTAARAPRVSTPRPSTASVDYAEVADRLVAIRAEGRPVQQALVDEYKVPLTTVKNWITKIYKLGLAPRPSQDTPIEWDLPKRRATLDHEADTVYRCSECGDERATLEGLGEHTWATHQRPTRIAEQMAVRPTSSAA